LELGMCGLRCTDPALIGGVALDSSAFAAQGLLDSLALVQQIAQGRQQVQPSGCWPPVTG
jgi:hypothetical protein